MTDTTKHSPGPWDFEPVKVMMGYSQGIGFINLSVKQMTIEQAWNDKKLMDAAPELLAACKKLLVKSSQQHLVTVLSNREMEAVFEMVRLIDRIEG